MKKIVWVMALCVFASCGSGDYSPFVYTNRSTYAVSFRTNEKDSPLYGLKKGEFKSLDSDVRGRDEIASDSLKPAYVTWKRKGADPGHGRTGDIYHIEFIERESFPVEITNNTSEAITLTETGGYLEPESVDVPASGTPSARVYTETPEFAISENKKPAAVRFNSTEDTAGKKIMHVLLGN
jgi:hypothetical protein